MKTIEMVEAATPLRVLHLIGYLCHGGLEIWFMDMMRNKLGLNAYYLPESFSPRLHVKPDRSKEDCEAEMRADIVVAGTLYLYRIRFLESLFDILPDNLRIVLYGNTLSWAPKTLSKYHTGKPIFGAKKSAVFFGAKIVINNMHYCEFEGINCLFFEVLGCGGFQLCDDKAALPNLAVPGKEVVTFRDLHECADKIQYYLSHPEERWAIAEAG